MSLRSNNSSLYSDRTPIAPSSQKIFRSQLGHWDSTHPHIKKPRNSPIFWALWQGKEDKCKLGDIWELGEHRLVVGDSTHPQTIHKLISTEKVGGIGIGAIAPTPSCRKIFQNHTFSAPYHSLTIPQQDLA
ncbi:MAG: hypothetical protein NHB32_03440 [Fischerella sp. CENA71]|nr:hypothetical protein [Fischerella sp. CENA71]